MRISRDSTLSTAPSVCAALVTSRVRGVTRPSAWAKGWRVPAYTRFAPLLKASSTSACPIPRLAPVTRTTRPSIVIAFVLIQPPCGLSDRDPRRRRSPSRACGTRHDRDRQVRPHGERHRFGYLRRTRKCCLCPALGKAVPRTVPKCRAAIAAPPAMEIPNCPRFDKSDGQVEGPMRTQIETLLARERTPTP